MKYYGVYEKEAYLMYCITEDEVENFNNNPKNARDGMFLVETTKNIYDKMKNTKVIIGNGPFVFQL